MADVVNKAKRSTMMAGIRGRDTKLELRIRKALHAAGFRFRLHVRSLPGRPDLVFPKYRAVVFAQGCFWHRHQGCVFAKTPATNVAFWSKKFQDNIERDSRVLSALLESGWRVAIVWECAVRSKSDTDISRVVGTWLVGRRRQLSMSGLVV